MDLHLDHPGFHASVADLRRACSDISLGRTTARGQVSLLMDGGWTGRAATAFGTAWDDWVLASVRLERQLTGIADVLVAVKDSLDVVDGTVASRFSAGSVR
jgi:uncharacterized protein YukE